MFSPPRLHVEIGREPRSYVNLCLLELKQAEEWFKTAHAIKVKLLYVTLVYYN